MTAVKSVTMETKRVVEKYDFTWKIHEFSKHKKSIKSAPFTPLSNRRNQYYVTIDFNISTVYLSLSTKLFLRNLCVAAESKFTDSQGTLLKSIPKSLSKRFSLEGILCLGKWTEENVFDMDNWVFFPKRPDDDILMVNIHFKFFGHELETKSVVPFSIKTPLKKLSVLSSDFRNLYKSKVLTDITILIDGSVVQAHQSVLAARSPVFKRMLQSSCLESNTKCLTVTDVDFKVFECFLEYLYSGVLEDITFPTVYRLYSVADKYAVTSLQEVCGDILASNLNSENVCCVLELSYLHSDKTLQNKAAYFVSTCCKKIQSKPEWKKMLKQHPKLISEVFDSFSLN